MYVPVAAVESRSLQTLLLFLVRAIDTTAAAAIDYIESRRPISSMRTHNP